MEWLEVYGFDSNKSSVKGTGINFLHNNPAVGKKKKSIFYEQNLMQPVNVYLCQAKQDFTSQFCELVIRILTNILTVYEFLHH
jgi:hypothetical protein